MVNINFSPRFARIATFCGALLLPASCSHEDDLRTSGLVPATFTTQISGSSSGVVTRASDTSWDETDRVGVHMSSSKDKLSGSAPADFRLYTVGSDLRTLTSAAPWFYPADNSDVWFTAFYPYNESVAVDGSNKVKYTLPTALATANDLKDFDFLYYSNADQAFCSSKPADNLVFEHKFSKLVINVKDGGSLGADFNSLTVKINHIPTEVTVPLATGTPDTPTNPQEITLFKDPSSTDEQAVFKAIVPPHVISGGNKRTVTFTAGNKNYYYDVADEYESGTAYVYDFRLTGTDVVLSASDITDWDGGEAAWNNQHVIRCAVPKVELFKEEYSGTVTVSTNFDGNLSASPISSTWLTGVSAIAVSGSSPAADGYYYWTINYTAAANSGTSTRNGILRVFADKLELDIAVVQSNGTAFELNTDLSDMSNCYILPPGGYTVSIPAGKLVKYYNEDSGLLHGTKYTIGSAAMVADVLWSDVSADDTSAGVVNAGSAVSTVSVEGTGADAVIRVTSGTTQGNVVLVFRDNATKTIRWSFHIWVTDYDPRKNFGTIGSYTLMDRNLGAVNAIPGSVGSLGLLYQWGRKDPFPGSASVSSSTDPYIWLSKDNGATYTKTRPYTDLISNGFSSDGNQRTISASLETPFMFFWRSSSSPDWTDSGKTYDPLSAAPVTSTLRRWQTNGGLGKAIDDPCPNRYRVADYEALALFNASNLTNLHDWNPRGRVSPSAGWWPATGRRRNDSYGSLSFVGTYGNYWSSRLNGSGYAYYLYVTSGNVSMDRYARSDGYGVRCLLY